MQLFQKNLLKANFWTRKRCLTNATFEKRGKFELANHGTLFLDEIGDMSPKLKILGSFRSSSSKELVGTIQLSVDVRVIAATNMNLETEIANGNFREDLYYRLNVIPIEMPTIKRKKIRYSIANRAFFRTHVS